MTNQELITKLENTITNIPDFPKEGIQFKDITPIFLNPKLYEEAVDEMVNREPWLYFRYCYRCETRRSIYFNKKKRKASSAIHRRKI